MMSKKGPSTTGKNRTGTVNGDRGNQVLSQEASRLFKTQDLGYVRTMRNVISKEVEELEGRAKGIKGTGKKIVFVEDEDEQIRRLTEDDPDMDQDEADEEGEFDVELRKLRRMQQKEADKVDTKLSIARERLKALKDAEEALDLQRAKMAKSPTVGGVNKHGISYKVRERKR